VITCPLFVVNVTEPSLEVTFTPQSSGRICGVHGITTISTVPAIEAVAGSANKPAKAIVLVHLCLNMMRRAPSPKVVAITEPTNGPDKSNYPRIPSVP
jgi:hypothetical protein